MQKVMLPIRTVEDVISNLPPTCCDVLPSPNYKITKGVREEKRNNGSNCVGLAVENMKFHTTDEGWQIFDSLLEAGWVLEGYSLGNGLTDVSKIVKLYNPVSLLLQDKREWDVQKGDFRSPKARFTEVEYLKNRDDIFKLTILKDAHQKTSYHCYSAMEIGCHAWVIYYHPKIVKHLAPYVREEHLVRTYHTLDSKLVPEYKWQQRRGCILSGAVSKVYPLRERLIRDRRLLPHTEYQQHPGYHRRGCATPEYLKLLSQFGVAICTSSIYGYALRKIIEATACGCRVLTDLPTDEVLPDIDGNLYRINPDTPTTDVAEILQQMMHSYDPEIQKDYSDKARRYYDYKVMGIRLADNIDTMRRSYNATSI